MPLKRTCGCSANSASVVIGVARTRSGAANSGVSIRASILQLNDGQFADFVFGWDYDMFGDGSKLRRAGFSGYQATDEMFFTLFTQLRAARIIP